MKKIKEYDGLPKVAAKLHGFDPDFDESAYNIYVILVTQIERIYFFNLTSYFQIYGTFKFYENVNFRVNGLFKNPHCAKYINATYLL